MTVKARVCGRRETSSCSRARLEQDGAVTSPRGRSRGPSAVDRGITLVELLVTIALLVITLSIAAPGLTSWGRNTRLTGQASDLQSALNYARSESQRRGTRVALCALASPAPATPRCGTAAKWSQGWIVFTDNVHVAANQVGVIDGEDLVLRVGDSLRNSTVTVDGNVDSWLAFSPQGLLRAKTGPASGNITICQPPLGRRINVSPVGLVRITEETC